MDDDDDDVGNDRDDDSEDEQDEEEDEEEEYSSFPKVRQKMKASEKGKMPVMRNPNRASNGKFATSSSGHQTPIPSSPPIVRSIPSTGPWTELAKALNISEKVLRKVVHTIQSNNKSLEVNSMQVTQQPITPKKRPTQLLATDDEKDNGDTPETPAPQKWRKPSPRITICTPVPLAKQTSAQGTICATKICFMAERLADEVPLSIKIYIQTSFRLDQ